MTGWAVYPSSQIPITVLRYISAGNGIFTWVCSEPFTTSVIVYLVQDKGIEPLWYFYRQILNLLRLPVSPILHIKQTTIEFNGVILTQLYV